MSLRLSDDEEELLIFAYDIYLKDENGRGPGWITPVAAKKEPYLKRSTEQELVRGLEELVGYGLVSKNPHFRDLYKLTKAGAKVAEPLWNARHRVDAGDYSHGNI